MNLLRGLLFDNLGVKLIALVMAMLVYLNAYTERPVAYRKRPSRLRSICWIDAYCCS